jgi:hypothetical protein
MRPKSTRATAKYFVKGAMPEGSAEQSDKQSGFVLRLEWPADRVPYLAALIDEGSSDGLYSIFLETATASFDPTGSRARSRLVRDASGRQLV